jgi:transcriptional regulator with XRE-family HTH domain
MPYLSPDLLRASRRAQAAGLSILEQARAAGVNRSTLSQFLHGASVRPDHPAVLRLGALLGVPAAQCFAEACPADEPRGGHTFPDRLAALRAAALALWTAQDAQTDTTPLARDAAELFHELGTTIGLAMPPAAAMVPTEGPCRARS